MPVRRGGGRSAPPRPPSGPPGRSRGRRGRGRCRRRRRAASAVVARVASSRSSPGRSSTLPRVDFRDAPRRIGRPRTRSAARSRRSATLWSAVLPNPKPGSTTIASHATPAREGPVDRGLQVGDHLRQEVRVARLGPVVHQDDRDARAPRRAARSSSCVAVPQMSLTRPAPASSAAAATARLRRVDADRHVRQDGADRGDDGHHPGDLGVGVDDGMARSRGLAADVEEVGALVDHPARLVDRGRDRVARGQEPVAGERVRGDVEDPHDVRPLAPGERRGRRSAAAPERPAGRTRRRRAGAGTAWRPRHPARGGRVTTVGSGSAGGVIAADCHPDRGAPGRRRAGPARLRRGRASRRRSPDPPDRSARDRAPGRGRARSRRSPSGPSGSARRSRAGRRAGPAAC